MLTTDLVWFLDSDDTAAPEFVDTLVSAMERGGCPDVGHPTYRVDEHDQPTDRRGPSARRCHHRRRVRPRTSSGRAKAYACTKLFERASLGTRPWAEDQAYEDIATSIRVALSVIGWR